MIPRHYTPHSYERGPGMEFLRKRTCGKCGIEFETTSAKHCPPCRKLVKAARKCRVCGRQAFTRGLCSTHYQAKREGRL